MKAPEAPEAPTRWEIWRDAGRRGSSWRRIGWWDGELPARAWYAREVARMRAGSVALVRVGTDVESVTDLLHAVSWRPRGASQTAIVDVSAAPWLRSRR